MDTYYTDNSIPPELIKTGNKISIFFLFMFLIVGCAFFLFWRPTTIMGDIISIFVIVVVAFAYEYVSYKSIYWHFSKIRFTPEGIHFYRDKVKYLPKHRFIPWEKILGFNLGKNAAILTINYNPYYLYGEAKEKTPYYFLLYGVKKNPKIKEFIERRYPILFEQYRDVLEKEGGENLKIEGGDR